MTAATPDYALAWTWPMVAVVVLLLLAAFSYWTVVVTEGAYVGPRLVRMLYDRGAKSYDEIKGFDSGDEAWFLGQPLERALRRVRHPLVLDVATGTGRVPLALLRRLDFDGHVVGLDGSSGMLGEAAGKLGGYGPGRFTLMLKDATTLPFADRAFDAVTCLEALEFLPDPSATLREMARVLKPGGLFLISNRIGRDARLMPGRAYGRDLLRSKLARLGLAGVEFQIWQEDYDLVWARKPGASSGRARPLEAVVRCPNCRADGLLLESGSASCAVCRIRYRRAGGVLRFDTSTSPCSRSIR